MKITSKLSYDRYKKMKEVFAMNKYIQVLKDYVEGAIDVVKVKEYVEKDSGFKKLLKTKLNRNHPFYKKYNDNIYDYLVQLFPLSSNWDTVQMSAIVYMEFTRLLKWFNIPYNDYVKYMGDCYYTQDEQPLLLNERDQFIKKLWYYETIYHTKAYTLDQLKAMKKGLPPQVNQEAMHIHHVKGKQDIQTVVKFTRQEHFMFHDKFEYCFNSNFNMDSIQSLFK